MIQVGGTYNKGKITLDKALSIDKPVKVLVTFVEEEDFITTNRLTINDFSFLKSRKLLHDVKGTLSDAVTDERRNAL